MHYVHLGMQNLHVSISKTAEKPPKTPIYPWYDDCNRISVVLTFTCTTSADVGPVQQRGKNLDRPDFGRKYFISSIK